MIVFDKERALCECSETCSDFSIVLNPLSNVSAKTSPIGSAPPATSTPSPMESKIDKLTDRFSRLTPMLEANVSVKLTSAINIPRAIPGAMSRPLGECLSNCIWCDTTDHLCPSFMEVLRKEKVQYNENRRLINVTIGEKLPLYFGRGGQQAL